MSTVTLIDSWQCDSYSVPEEDMQSQSQRRPGSPQTMGRVNKGKRFEKQKQCCCCGRSTVDTWKQSQPAYIWTRTWMRSDGLGNNSTTPNRREQRLRVGAGGNWFITTRLWSEPTYPRSLPSSSWVRMNHPAKIAANSSSLSAASTLILPPVFASRQSRCRANGMTEFERTIEVN